LGEREVKGEGGREGKVREGRLLKKGGKRENDTLDEIKRERLIKRRKREEEKRTAMDGMW